NSVLNPSTARTASCVNEPKAPQHGECRASAERTPPPTLDKRAVGVPFGVHRNTGRCSRTLF
ncbi:hypothetical protein TNCV_4287011, partial [Trichonephila clavipes]